MQSRFRDDDERRRLAEEHIAALNRQIVSNFRTFGGKISALLFRHDPLGLNIGPNHAEYEPEARVIVQRLLKCGTEADVLALVHRVFVANRGCEKAGEPTTYLKIAHEIWAWWEQWMKGTQQNAT